jgi:hypothetical protein
MPPTKDDKPSSAFDFNPSTSVFSSAYERSEALSGNLGNQASYLASQEIHSQGLKAKGLEDTSIYGSNVGPVEAVTNLVTTGTVQGKKDDDKSKDKENDKVLCDLIHRYGYLDEDIWRLDEAFGDRVAIEDPELMEGYHTWAKPMVAWIEKESFLAKLYLKYWCVPFTRRWANHIAHIMEPENYKPDYVGKLMLAIGVPISRAIYKLKGRKLKTV